MHRHVAPRVHRGAEHWTRCFWFRGVGRVRQLDGVSAAACENGSATRGRQKRFDLWLLPPESEARMVNESSLSDKVGLPRCFVSLYRPLQSTGDSFKLDHLISPDSWGRPRHSQCRLHTDRKINGEFYTWISRLINREKKTHEGPLTQGVYSSLNSSLNRFTGWVSIKLFAISYLQVI